jgi:hypothetical protein
MIPLDDALAAASEFIQRATIYHYSSFYVPAGPARAILHRKKEFDSPEAIL